MRDVALDFFDFCSFPRTLVGRAYLLDILLSIKDAQNVETSKILYLDVQKRYNTTPQCIEKSLQTVIDKTWCNENLATAFCERPTSREFIVVLKHRVDSHVPCRSVCDLLFN